MLGRGTGAVDQCPAKQVHGLGKKPVVVDDKEDSVRGQDIGIWFYGIECGVEVEDAGDSDR